MEAPHPRSAVLRTRLFSSSSYGGSISSSSSSNATRSKSSSGSGKRKGGKMRNLMDPAAPDRDEDDGDDDDVEAAAARKAFGGEPAGKPAAAAVGAKQSEFMDKFFKELERAKQSIQRIKTATTEVKSLEDEALSAIGAEAEQAVSEKLARVLTQANKDCALAKRVLEGLKSETEKLDRKRLQSEIRIRENVHATVLQNLVAAVRS